MAGPLAKLVSDWPCSRRGFIAGAAALAAADATGGSVHGATGQPDSDSTRLWYSEPARTWEEALPVGNGRIGAMVFGGVTDERIQLNEDTLWSGGPYDPVNPDARDALPAVRRLIEQREFASARLLRTNA